MHTAEVEEIHESSEHLSTVYIVKVLEVRKHPDSEKLNICKIVHNDTELQIICGAPNVRA
jgi:phenylalanyl-tRNA synthetase beta chain